MGSHLLLTGATGLIGRGWLPMLLTADPRRCITVLVRVPEKIPTHPRVRFLQGDLSQPRLGVSSETSEWLASTLTDIVHCAADVRFTRSLEEARSVNTEGALSLLSLAKESKQLRRFAHVSTTYVMGRDAGVLPECRYSNSRGFVNTYQQAKYEAEEAVFAALPEVPAAVFRLSSVVGKQTNYLHQALRFIPRNPFPVVPAAPGCRMDFIPECWAVAALSLLFECYFKTGRVYHVCAGGQGSIPVETLIEMAYSQFSVHRAPAMVSAAEFERFAHKLIRDGAREPVKLILRRYGSNAG